MYKPVQKYRACIRGQQRQQCYDPMNDIGVALHSPSVQTLCENFHADAFSIFLYQLPLSRYLSHSLSAEVACVFLGLMTVKNG